jgi:predicted enzyme related to lactoylglutathione lyase
MSDDKRTGFPAWHDLTVEDGEGVRRFYESVIGWTSQPVDMGGYEDFNMQPPGADAPAAGICHARGGNADLPPQWLVYFTVAHLDSSLAQVETKGGKVLKGPVDLGAMGRYAVISDPAGAICALFADGK